MSTSTFAEPSVTVFSRSSFSFLLFFFSSLFVRAFPAVICSCDACLVRFCSLKVKHHEAGGTEFLCFGCPSLARGIPMWDNSKILGGTGRAGERVKRAEGEGLALPRRFSSSVVLRPLFFPDMQFSFLIFIAFATLCYACPPGNWNDNWSCSGQQCTLSITSELVGGCRCYDQYDLHGTFVSATWTSNKHAHCQTYYASGSTFTVKCDNHSWLSSGISSTVIVTLSNSTQSPTSTNFKCRMFQEKGLVLAPENPFESPREKMGEDGSRQKMQLQ